MRDSADEDIVKDRILVLRMTAQTEVRIVLGEHFEIDRAMGIVTGAAPFTHRLVLEDHRPGLLAVALGAALVEPRHRQPAGRPGDVSAVRVVALDAIHTPLDDGMMMRQIEFGARLEMTLQARGRVLAGIDNESGAAGGDVFAAGAMAGFTTALSLPIGEFEMDPGVRTRGEPSDDAGVAVEASLVADKSCAWNIRWRVNRAIHAGA